MEEWKDVKGYEGLYKISNLGRIKRLYKNGKERIRTLHKRGKYYCIDLWKNGKCECVNVHRLVASAFINNPDSLPCVNHKDENSLNNNVNNLEWCTQQYNTEYSISTPVLGINIFSGFIKEFRSQKNASDTLAINKGNINSVCKGIRKQAGNYKFLYLGGI